jgi:hypothetical protein
VTSLLITPGIFYLNEGGVMDILSKRNCIITIPLLYIIILFSSCSIPTIDLSGFGNWGDPGPSNYGDFGFGSLYFTKSTYVAVYDSLQMEPINGANCYVEEIPDWCLTDSTFVTGEHGIVNVVVKMKHPDVTEYSVNVSADGYKSRQAMIVFDTQTDLILLQATKE